MKRKMIGAASAYLSGSFFALFFHDLRAWLIAALMCGAVLFFGQKRGWKITDDVLVAVAFLIGAAVFSVYTYLCYKPLTACDGQSGCFVGTVTEITRYENDRAGYVLKGKVNGTVKGKVTYFGMDVSAEYGDIISIDNCTFSVPRSDYAFDSESYYKSEGIFLTLSNVKAVSVTHTHSHIIRNKAAQFRERMTQRLKECSDDTTGGFLAAMLFGEKRQLDSDVKTALYRSGIGHILAVSGIHVSIIAVLLMSVLKRLHISRFAAYGILNAFLILFVVMANSPFSAIRATIMMDFFYAAGLFRRQNDSLNSLAASALIIAIFQPYAIMNAGYLLSLSGTFGIAVFAPFMTKNMKYDTFGEILAKDFVSALLTAISVLPMCVLFFDETSLISPISNVLLVPLCTAAMVNGVVFVLTGGSLPILFPAKMFIHTVVYVSRKIAVSGLFHIPCGSKHSAELLIFLGFACLGLYFIAHSRRAVAVGVAVGLAVFAVTSTAESRKRFDEFTVAVLGRGTNVAVVVTYKGAADIIDLSGSTLSPRYVMRYLTVNGIRNVGNIALTRNVPAVYEAYSEELDYITADNLIVSDGKDYTVSNAEIFPKHGGFSIDRDAYAINFADGTLNVRRGETTITLQPASSDAEVQTDWDIRYGNIPEKSDIQPKSDAVYLDGNNNFEIVLSENGSFGRRL